MLLINQVFDLIIIDDPEKFGNPTIIKYDIKCNSPFSSIKQLSYLQSTFYVNMNVLCLYYLPTTWLGFVYKYANVFEPKPGSGGIHKPRCLPWEEEGCQMIILVSFKKRQTDGFRTFWKLTVDALYGFIHEENDSKLMKSKYFGSDLCLLMVLRCTNLCPILVHFVPLVIDHNPGYKS